MPSKAELIEAMERECDLCVHLHGKVPAGGMKFRFTPPQRSTEELLRYLSFAPLAIAQSVVAGNWDAYEAAEESAKNFKPSKFPAAMEAQKKGLRALIGGIPEKDLAAKTFEQPWGTKRPLGAALLEFPYACLVAYRMQLFLQAKVAGNAALSTSNCWGGRDAKA